jgi:Polyketide cyclase / dehydrase and lipid transport
MKIIKKILIGLVVLIVILLVAALFVKSEFSIEREIVINKPKQEVFDYIKYVKNSNYYSKWTSLDPNIKKEYKGTDGQVGFIYSWDSNKEGVGKGEQEIKKITEGERIDYELRFLKPFKATDTAYMTTEEAENNQTKVKWGFKGKVAYPFNLMCLFMNMDEMIGKDLDTGLTNLKNLLEKK